MGSIRSHAISHNDERIPMQRSFSVQDGVLMVDGAVQERLNLQLPQSNFNGQLLQLGEPLAGFNHLYVIQLWTRSNLLVLPYID